jgi:hypothetical protein
LVNFTISFDADQAISKLGAIDISRIVREELDRGGDLIMNDAKAKVHVVSGKLKNSGRVTKHDNKVEGSFNTPYAASEEKRQGGKYTGSHAYLGPSVEKNASIIDKNIRDRLTREFA